MGFGSPQHVKVTTFLRFRSTPSTILLLLYLAILIVSHSVVECDNDTEVITEVKAENKRPSYTITSFGKDPEIVDFVDEEITCRRERYTRIFHHGTEVIDFDSSEYSEKRRCVLTFRMTKGVKAKVTCSLLDAPCSVDGGSYQFMYKIDRFKNSNICTDNTNKTVEWKRTFGGSQNSWRRVIFKFRKREGYRPGFACRIVASKMGQDSDGDECGQANIAQGQIFNGAVTDPHELPWSVVLKAGSKFCGATILDDWYMLTTASCVQGRTPIQITAYMGCHSRFSCEAVQEIEEIVVHPDFNFPASNLALLKTTRRISVYTRASPICLPSQDLPATTAILLTAGWGSDSEGGTLSDNLKKATITTVDCDTEYGSGVIPSDTFCTSPNVGASNEGGLCYGDIGGFTGIYRNGKYELAGVSQFYDYNAAACEGTAGGHTNVFYHLTWILSVIQ